jgi:hypothetical protein
MTQKRKCNFDFSTLASLTSLRTTWNHGFVGLTQLSNLEELEIERIYQLNHLDLSGLNRLKRLQLSGGRNVRSLSLDGVRSLESLTLAGFQNLERIEHFQSGDSVLHLDVAGVKKVEPSFWRAFTRVQAAYVSPKDPITRESFGIRPKLFARWPSS